MENANMKLAPIVIFAYNRPQHLRQTVDALLKNEYAKESDVIIYSDGAKDEKTKESVEETRRYIHSIIGFRSIQIIEREKNMGLSNNIIDGVTSVVNKYGRVIVLEDDLLTSPYFLKFMNEGLQKYEFCDEVICIQGHVYSIKNTLPENFFLQHTDSLGWGTWKKSWELFNPDGVFLLRRLYEQNLVKQFNFNNTYNFVKMLRGQIEGRNNSWAIRWYASVFLEKKLSLFPNKSLICHKGNDELATHCKYDDDWLEVEVSDVPISVIEIPVKEDENIRIYYEKFFHSVHKNLLRKMRKKIKKYCREMMQITKKYFDLLPQKSADTNIR